MAQKNIGTGWTRESRNAMNDNFDELYANYIGAGSSAAEAERLAKEAVAAAKAAKIESASAKEEAEETQRQLDTLIIESGTSDAEVIQARGGEPLLKDRLNKTDAQLAESAQLTAELRRVAAANAPSPLDIPTYVARDNHAVHPRVIWDATKKYGYEWIMAFTPYSRSDDQYENPSIVVSNNGKKWTVPVGLANPIVDPKQPGILHLSDTDLFDNGTELEMWYRESDKAALPRVSRLMRVKSTDCVNWSTPEVVFDFGTGGYGYGSSSVVMRNGYELYYREHMNLNSEGYVLQKATTYGNWSPRQAVNFDFGDMWKEYISWHIEVNYIDGVYYCLNHAAKDGAHYDGKLFLFESIDGVNFGNVKLLMAKSDVGFDNSNLYKSSMVKWGNQWWIYYSAFDKDGGNRIGLSIGRDFDNLSGYDQNAEGVYNVSEIDSSGDRVRIRKSVEFFERSTIAETGGGIGYLGSKANWFLKSYRYETTDASGGFEGVGFLFNSLTGAGFPTPDKMAVHDDSKQRLNLRNNGVLGEIPKMIHITLTANSGDGTVEYHSGKDYIASVASTQWGFAINLKNLPSTIRPNVMLAHSGSAPPKTVDNKYAKDWYIRGAIPTVVNIGLKADVTVPGELAFNTLSAGKFEITILF